MELFSDILSEFMANGYNAFYISRMTGIDMRTVYYHKSGLKFPHRSTFERYCIILFPNCDNVTSLYYKYKGAFYENLRMAAE